MGKKIPGKKHRRNTSAEEQIEKREALLRLKVTRGDQKCFLKFENNINYNCEWHDVFAFRLTLLQRKNLSMNKKFLKD